MRQRITSIVLGIIILVCGGLLINAIATVRAAADKSKCANNIKQITISVHNYASTYQDRIPLAILPNQNLSPEESFSWLFAMIPYLEADTLYSRTNKTKGWSAEENLWVARIPITTYLCPAVGPRESNGIVPTNYLGITGLGQDAVNLKEGDPRAGFFSYAREFRLPDIMEWNPKGTPIVVMETSLTKGAWTAGGTGTVRGFVPEARPYLGAGRTFGGTHSGGAYVAYLDGSVHFIAERIDPEVLEALATLKPVEKAKNLTDY